MKESNKNHLVIELPIIGGVLLAYTATVFFQSTHNWNVEAISGFSIVIVLHIALYLFRELIFHNKFSIYFIVQGVVIFLLSIIIKENYQAAYLGLIPLIVTQSIHLFKDKRKAIYATIYYYNIYCITVIIYDGLNNLLYSISLLMLITSSILAYGYLYARQVSGNEKTQQLLLELETAYDKLEEMARESERQKLARDIHDTLSQGLVGALIKLEALEINLEKGNIEKSKAITKNSITHVRENLKEAREIIRDLRVHHEEIKDLNIAIEKELELFKRDTKLELVMNRYGSLNVSSVMYKNITYIVREILSNIKKHAKASKIIVNSSLETDNIFIRIEDNGVGFDYLHFYRSYGHYGIIGMKERAKAIQGKLEIESSIKNGTCITLIIPINEPFTRS
ncbi:MAG: integral rane sensor signal transduction histidine kinase [Anaerocolumna sp.]|jgi:NarL family two-component system sensor histidine kinase YdfH|nr:integral rane sensor signal transduction histidine kinase [Anaerocolumna sp.]